MEKSEVVLQLTVLLVTCHLSLVTRLSIDFGVT